MFFLPRNQCLGSVLFILTVFGFPLIFAENTIANGAGTAQTEATILKRTVQITPRRFLRWWRNPAAADPVYDTWSWAPEIKFAINGPVAAGSQITVEFDAADGKPWFSQRMRTPQLQPDFWEIVSDRENLSNEELEKKAITAPAGLFGFRIRLKNAIAGTDTVLFTGKYKITTYAPNQAIPEYKGRKEFYVDEDWRLPMAWLWLNPTNNEDAPILCLQTWFKNSASSDNIEAFLYYNGKQLFNTKSGSAEDTLTNGVDEQPYRYSLRMFYFYNVRGFNKSSSQAYDSAHFLDKNPGSYEIKILRNGELARTLPFTVGKDGKISDNSVTAQNKLGGIRALLPIKVVGAADGKLNAAAWQTEAFYGNPLTGFMAIP